MMVPLLEEFNQELEDKADVVKFNCNKENKELGVTLGIKVAPTFHLYKGEKQVSLTAACTHACFTDIVHVTTPMQFRGP